MKFAFYKIVISDYKMEMKSETGRITLCIILQVCIRAICVKSQVPRALINKIIYVLLSVHNRARK